MYKVIIIEDDPMVASINKQYVEVTPEFRVDRIFKNGSEALPYLKTNPTDLIILDYYTPVMNGGEFLDALHNAGLTPSVIMVTSANDTDIVRSLLNRGITDYLVKPFEYTRFKTALDRFTETKKNLSPVLGLEGYQKIMEQYREAGLKIPIFAIGGIQFEDIAHLMETGIEGIAVSGAIINADDPVEETRRFIREINKHKPDPCRDDSEI